MAVWEVWRLETRVTRLYTDIGWLEETHGWPRLKAIATVTATRETGDVVQTHIRHFVLSKVLDAETAAQLIRGHWGIENSLHWVLDVVMDEDAHRARKDNAPFNFALIRRAALNIIKADKSKGSNRIKFKRAGWDNQFLRQLITNI